MARTGGPVADVARRRVLSAAAVALPGLVSGCASVPPLAPETAIANPDRVSPRALLCIGDHGRVRGVCLGPGRDDYRGDSTWTGLWQRWDWDGRIKNELDDAVSIGANCVRLFGNTHVVTSNVISFEQYLLRWAQFLDYAASVGLWVYPCGGDLSHWGDRTTLADAERIYGGWAQLLKGYDNVIGVDVTNEAHAQSRITGGIAYQEPESWLYTVKRLGEIVRSTSGKPITHSRGAIKDAPQSWLAGSPETDFLSDFIDVHAYRAKTPHEADGLYRAEWAVNKQLIIGEFGADMTQSSASRSAAYDEIKELISSSINCVGGLAWAIYDTGSELSSQYGLFDNDRQLRADIAAKYRDIPTTR